MHTAPSSPRGLLHSLPEMASDAPSNSGPAESQPPPQALPVVTPQLPPSGSDGAPASGADPRFEVELEFLQCLASPTYLHFLAQNQYLDDAAFLRYLSYLMYWTKPAYAKFVTFPHALYFLPLLQREAFRTALKSPQYALLLHQQQGFHWQFSASPAFRARKPGDPAPVVPGMTPMVPDPGAPSPSVIDPSPGPGFETPTATPAVHTPALLTPSQP